jgi:hypothetical protein
MSGRKPTGAPRRPWPLPQFPFDPIVALYPQHTDNELADELGVTRRQVQRYRAQGLSLWTADSVACAVDYHPEVLWSDWGPAADAWATRPSEYNKRSTDWSEP